MGKSSVSVYKPNGRYNGGGTARYRKDRQEIAEIAARMYDEATPVYTLADLVDEIRVNAEAYTNLLRNQIKDHEDLINKDGEVKVRDAIDACILSPVGKIRRNLNEKGT